MSVAASQLIGEVEIRGVDNAKRQLGEMDSATKSSQRELKLLRPAAEEASSSLGGRLLGSIKSVAGGAVDAISKAGLFIGGLTGIAGAALGLGKALLGPNAALEQTRVSFAAFIPDAKDLTATLADLKKFSAVTPFEGPEVNQAALSLLNMKVNARDLTTWIGNMGAAVSKVGGSGQQLDEVAGIIQQMGVKGKVTTEEMMQLSERNIPVFQILADAMGVPVASLQKMISNSELGQDKIELLVQSMGKFGGDAMIQQGKTFNGMLSTVSDNAKQALATFTGPLFDMAKGGLQKLADLVSSDAFQGFAKTMGEGVGNALQNIGRTIGGVVTHVQDFVGSINRFESANFVRGLTNLGGSLSYLFGVLGGTALNIFEQFKSHLDGLGSPAEHIGSILGHLGNYLSDASKYVHEFASYLGSINYAPFIDGIAGIVGPMAADFVPLLQNIVGLLKNQLGKVLQDVGKDLQAFGAWFMSDVMPALQKAMPGFQSLADTLLRDVIPATIKIKDVVIDFVQHALEILAPIIGRLVPPMIEFAGVLAGGISNALKFLTPLVVSISQEIGKFANELIDRLAPIATQVIDGILSGVKNFSTFWNYIWPFMSGILGGVWKEIQGIVQIAWSIVSGIIKIGLDLLSGNWRRAWDDLKTMLSGVWDGIKKFVQGGIDNVILIVKTVTEPIKKPFFDAWEGVKGFFAGIGPWFHDRWLDIINKISSLSQSLKDNILKPFNDVKNGIGSIIKGFANSIVDNLNNGITAVQNFLNFMKGGLVSAAHNLGITLTIDDVVLPKIAHFARGGTHEGGPMIVGEEGPELMFAPRGTNILPNKQSMALLRGMGIPGYAEGTGNAAVDAWNWITQTAGNVVNTVAGGAKSVLDWILSTFHITAPDLGGLSGFATGFFNKAKDAVLQWLTDHLPKIDFSGGSSGASGDVLGWIRQAMALTGVPSTWLNDLATIAMHESGGNPSAQNNWDINAQNGDPSRGLFQTIGATFSAYMLPGHGNILSGVDNAAAAIRYIMARYGDVFHVPGIMSMAAGGPYQGYANGTSYAPGGYSWVGERGRELMYIPRGAQIVSSSQISQAAGQGAQQPQIIVQPAPIYLDGRILAQSLMPYIVDQIRAGSGIINF
jgi:tape measure domain-containing protein